MEKFHKEKKFFNENYKHIKIDYFSILRYKNYFLKKPKKMSIVEANYDYTNTIIKSIDAVIAPMSTFAIECALNKLPVAIYLPQLRKEYDLGFSTKTDYFSFLINLIKPIIYESEDELYKTVIKLHSFKNIKKIKISFKIMQKLFIQKDIVKKYLRKSLR